MKRIYPILNVVEFMGFSVLFPFKVLISNLLSPFFFSICPLVRSPIPCSTFTHFSEHFDRLALRKGQENSPVMITWLDGLAEVEYRLSGGGGEVIQTGAVVGVVRNGAELI